eukprot:gene22784-29951_t
MPRATLSTSYLYEFEAIERAQFDINAPVREGKVAANMLATDGSVPVKESPAGVVWSYNVAGFPICAKVEMSQAVVRMNPCTKNMPHHHPRATEWIIVLQGSLNISMVEENGGRAATVLLDASGNGLPTYPIPRGLPHTQENLGCGFTIFVATFNHGDPGTVSHAAALHRFPATVLATALGITHAEAEEKIASINPASLGGLQIDKECQARCAAAKA